MSAEGRNQRLSLERIQRYSGDWCQGASKFNHGEVITRCWELASDGLEALVSEERDPVDEMISWEEAGIKSVTFEGKKYDADSEGLATK